MFYRKFPRNKNDIFVQNCLKIEAFYGNFWRIIAHTTGPLVLEIAFQNYNLTFSGLTLGESERPLEPTVEPDSSRCGLL